MKIYCTLFQNNHLMPTGFKVTPEKGSRADEVQARLDLALAALESVGIEAHFASEPGTADGEQPDDGYVDLEDE